jgi:UDP-2,3-diacylglucosamine hydrolase
MAQIEKGTYYFISDIHLGLNYKGPEEREKRFSTFLYAIPQEAEAVYLLGDIFDFWYEYKNVIPRGYTRTLGAIAALVDRGVKVYFFNGNHDIWTYSYLQKELGVEVLKQPYIFKVGDKKLCIGHGDGLGEGDLGYKFMNSIFKNRILQFLFSSIHPRWAFMLAHKWSKHNRLVKNLPYDFKNGEERIVKFSEKLQKNQPAGDKIDYFIYGHFHYKTLYKLENGGQMFLLGDWINTSNYLVFNGMEMFSCEY